MRSASRRRSDEPARPSNVQFQARGSTPSRRTGPAEVATEGRPDLDELIVDAAVRALGANRKDSDTRGSRPRKGRIPDGRQSLEVESHENTRYPSVGPPRPGRRAQRQSRTVRAGNPRRGSRVRRAQPQGDAQAPGRQRTSPSRSSPHGSASIRTLRRAQERRPGIRDPCQAARLPTRCGRKGY
jgi:hypothetical protein